MIETRTGDDTPLHKIKYSNCDAVDLLWYLQEGNWYHQFSGKQKEEIRERYILYCDGIRVDFP